MLQILDKKKSFGELHVLRGVDLDVEQGDVVAIIGPSGSGKTTLLRCTAPKNACGTQSLHGPRYTG